jgi:hypothetical protein
MPLTAAELSDINNATYETFLHKGTVLSQNIQEKPLMKALDGAAGSFAGGRDTVAFNVKAGQGGGTLQGYTADDQLSFYNPTGIKKARFTWKEHHIGTQITMTELKENGIDVIESGTNQRTSPMADREAQALANILDEKNEMMAEDYAASLNDLLWGDGTSDAKAIAGVRSIILDNPLAGTTGGLSRSIYPWWRNRAATAAHAGAGGQGAITSSATAGGALITFLDNEERQRVRYGTVGSKIIRLCGSDFIEAYEGELRANGYYSQTGFNGAQDGSMGEVSHKGVKLQYDPTLDDLGLAKRCYTLDIGRHGVKLLYMDGQRMKKHNPARPYDRMVMYNGITMTGVLTVRKLRTSGVYDIA